MLLKKKRWAFFCRCWSIFLLRFVTHNWLVSFRPTIVADEEKWWVCHLLHDILCVLYCLPLSWRAWVWPKCSSVLNLYQNITFSLVFRFKEKVLATFFFSFLKMKIVSIKYIKDCMHLNFFAVSADNACTVWMFFLLICDLRILVHLPVPANIALS